MKSLKTDIQIRFADADILGHINNVNLQHYFDLGKNEYAAKILGIAQMRSSAGLITAATNTSYMEQTRLDDQMYVETTVERIGTKSITIFQRLINAGTGKIHAESTSAMVAFDFEAQQTIVVPDTWRKAIGE